MISYSREDLLIAEQAAEWLHRLATANQQEREEFVRWLKQSPKHVREMLLATIWDKQLRHIDPNHAIDVDALARRYKNVIHLHKNR